MTILGKEISIKLIIGLFVIVGLVAVVFVRGNSMIAKPFIEAQLAEVAANIQSQAAAGGDEALLSYGEVELAGGVFNKLAKINDLRLEYTARLPFGNMEKTIISTPLALVTADQITENSAKIVFPDPFKVERGGFEPLLLNFDGKPIYDYVAKGSIEQHALKLPPKLVVSVEGSKVPVEVLVTYDAGATLKRHIDRTTSEIKSEVSFRNVKLASNAESNEVAVEGIHFTSKESETNARERQFEAVINIAGVVLRKLDKIDGPYNVSGDVSGSYSLPAVDAAQQSDIDNVNMVVNAFKFAAKDYTISASGTLGRLLDDPMLFGDADIAIQGLDKFRNSKLVGIQNESLKNIIIAAITGNADVAAPEANFKVKREKQGTFYIGETTFENLIGVIVTHALSSQPEPRAALEAQVAPLPAQSETAVSTESIVPVEKPIVPQAKVPTPE